MAEIGFTETPVSYVDSRGSTVSVVTDYGLDDLGGWSSSPGSGTNSAYRLHRL
jgi:hypothetical protein